MPTFYADDIDIEPHEFVSACRKKEIQELIEELVESGHLPPSVKSWSKKENPKGFHPMEVRLETSLDKLHGNYHRLTSEEEETIIKIANRL
jgi:hypothetical protein